MITLFTGAPGHGKTLTAVEHLVDREAPSGRPIFTNIEGFAFDRFQNVHPLEDPATWPETLPQGGLLIVDECHKWFPTRYHSRAVPAHVEALAEHRHRGQDVWLITQHPSSIDKFAADRVGRHIHAYRSFGLKGTTLYEWQVINRDPMPGQSLDNAIRKRVQFKKRLFEFYKSAELHVEKPRPPWGKIALLVGGVAFVVGAFFFARSTLAALGAEPEGSEAVHSSDDGEPHNSEAAGLWAGARAAGCRWVFLGRRDAGVLLVEVESGVRHLAFRADQAPGKICRFGPERG